MLQKVEGIIIRTSDYGETNKIITIFTRELGKIGVMARGAKKPKSRLSSISQLFIYGTFLYQKSSGLGTLQQGEIISTFRDVRNDLIRTSYASYIIELIDKLTEEKERNPYLFELLLQALQNINDEVDPEIITRIVEMKMLAVAGIKPELDRCANCKRQEGNFAFSIKEGGLLCEKCYNLDPHVIMISGATVKLLRLFFYFDLRRLGTISVKKETKEQLSQVISAYYEQYSGITLKSKRFLEQLDKMNYEFDK